MSYTLIERRELTAAASSIEFTAIPQFYTDLVLNVSSRTDGAGPDCLIRPNGSTSNMSGRRLRGNGSNVLSSIEGGYLENSVSTDTASTFSNGTAYFSNYSGSTFKSFSTDAVRENNATDSRQAIMANLWSDTAPITSITIVPSAAVNFVAGSTFSLYGINRQQAIGKPKAIGGEITFANGYWYHKFTGSGTFTTTEEIDTAQCLVVAGGGGGGGHLGAGGGAGGFLTFNSSFNINSSFLVLVGAGGLGAINTTFAGTSGINSTFHTTDSIGGGRGGGGGGTPLTGGSGGGGRGANLSGDQQSGVVGTSGQGNSGGAGSVGNESSESGGGGGAGSAGGNATTSAAGNGGAGSLWSDSNYYAGGGGGGVDGRNGGTPGTGGIGGGGNGIKSTNGNATSGTINTGGGGGGGSGGAGGVQSAGGAGGSGVVIVRYLAS
jgi:hypothetical protein